jgi:hypothetical protein
MIRSRSSQVRITVSVPQSPRNWHESSASVLVAYLRIPIPDEATTSTDDGTPLRRTRRPRPAKRLPRRSAPPGPAHRAIPFRAFSSGSASRAGWHRTTRSVGRAALALDERAAGSAPFAWLRHSPLPFAQSVALPWLRHSLGRAGKRAPAIAPVAGGRDRFRRKAVTPPLKVQVPASDDTQACPPGQRRYRSSLKRAVRPAPNGRFELHMMPN